MRKYLVAVSLVLAGPAMAQTAPVESDAMPPMALNVPVESDAIMSKDLSRDLISPAVSMIRAHGWRCDSISALLPFLMSRGFSVTCNQSRYKYNFEDKGGNWVVSLD